VSEMTWLYILGGVCLLALLLGLMRLGVKVRYNEQGFAAWARVGPVRVFIYPSAESRRKKKTAPEREAQQPEIAEKGGDLPAFKEMLEYVIKECGSLLRGIRMDQLVAELVIADEDPFETAMWFGGSSALVGLIIPPIENTFHVKKKQISVRADFEGEKTLIRLTAELSVPVWRLGGTGFRLALAFLRKRAQNRIKADT